MLQLSCPSCANREFELGEACPDCSRPLACNDGIYRALDADPQVDQFIREYTEVRHAEGRGSQSSEYYWSLPDVRHNGELSGELGAQWAMRAKTYRFFERKILEPLEGKVNVLDLGAGCGWLSYRLALAGHTPAAVDLLDDDLDGLGAARHYEAKLERMFPRFQARFERLPFADSQFELAIFNASFHYSHDYRATLQEVRRCLGWGGRVVILDTPVYRTWRDGERMVEERKSAFEQRYGFASDALLSMEYLDEGMLASLEKDLNISWRVYQPWYGLQWHMRPLKAKLGNRRAPSQFKVLVGSWVAA